jgi:hypothetical protein
MAKFSDKSWRSEDVEVSASGEAERLFAPWTVGRQPGWTCDPRTKNLVVLGLWLREELTAMGLSEADRKAQEWYFDRKSRAEDDLFALAALTLNNALEGKIDGYAGR